MIRTVDIRLIKADRTIYTGSQENAISWIQDILDAVSDFSLKNELNTMQVESHNGMTVDSVWFRKDTIPLYFINLLLKDYDMKFVEHQ